MPILTNAVVTALANIVKAIDFNDEHLEQVKPELRQLVRPLLERLFTILESFEHIKLSDNVQLSSAFESELEFVSFRTKLTNQSGHLVKFLTKIVPENMSGNLFKVNEIVSSLDKVFSNYTTYWAKKF